MWRHQLHDAVVQPIAGPATQGAWYRQWRVVSLDGSTLDIADAAQNATTFGRAAASRRNSAFPQVRFVSLVENGTHVLFGTRRGGVRTGEVSLAREVVGSLRAGMLCVADRLFYGFARTERAYVAWIRRFILFHGKRHPSEMGAI